MARSNPATLDPHSTLIEQKQAKSQLYSHSAFRISRTATSQALRLHLKSVLTVNITILGNEMASSAGST